MHRDSGVVQCTQYLAFGAVRTKYHRFGGLETAGISLSQFQRLEVQVKAAARSGSGSQTPVFLLCPHVVGGEQEHSWSLL